MTIKEIYDYADKIGVLIFSTIHNGEVQSRAAHFNGYDDEGIYFRTMGNKPYGRQLKETLKVTVSGICGGGIENHDDVGAIPEFQPGFVFRLIGDLRYMPPEEITEKAKTNKYLEVAARDIDMYPAMANGNYVIHRGRGEIFDYDFETKVRDHKVLRTRFAFGGAKVNPAGVRISDACVSCGICKKVCSFKAIEEGRPYKVISERCDDCGSCMLACPKNAILESLPL